MSNVRRLAAQLHQGIDLARGHRAYRLSEIACALGASLAEAARDVWRRSQRRRDARAVVRALGELDSRTRRDIGLATGECASLAAELATNCEPTRVSALQHSTAF